MRDFTLCGFAIDNPFGPSIKVKVPLATTKKRG